MLAKLMHMLYPARPESAQSAKGDGSAGDVLWSNVTEIPVLKSYFDAGPFQKMIGRLGLSEQALHHSVMQVVDGLYDEFVKNGAINPSERFSVANTPSRSIDDAMGKFSCMQSSIYSIIRNPGIDFGGMLDSSPEFNALHKLEGTERDGCRVVGDNSNNGHPSRTVYKDGGRLAGNIDWRISLNVALDEALIRGLDDFMLRNGGKSYKMFVGEPFNGLVMHQLDSINLYMLKEPTPEMIAELKALTKGKTRFTPDYSYAGAKVGEGIMLSPEYFNFQPADDTRRARLETLGLISRIDKMEARKPNKASLSAGDAEAYTRLLNEVENRVAVLHGLSPVHKHTNPAVPSKDMVRIYRRPRVEHRTTTVDEAMMLLQHVPIAAAIGTSQPK